MTSIIIVTIMFSTLSLPEELVFDVRYGPFTAGKIRFYIEQVDSLYKISCIEKTTGFLSSIYRINDKYEIWTDSSYMPMSYEDWKEEGSYKRHRKIDFHHDKQLAVYDDNKYTKELHANARELFSLIYYIRKLDFLPGDTLRFWLHEDKKNFELTIPVKLKEIDGKPYVEITPDVSDIKFFGGKGLSIYYDLNMTPVRFRFGFFLGNITAVLRD